MPITNFLNFTTNTSPATSDFVVGFVNDPGLRGQYEHKITFKTLFDYFTTYNATLTGITPSQLSTGRPFWDTFGNFTVYNQLNAPVILASGNISTSNGIIFSQGASNAVTVFDRNGSGASASFYKIGGNNYLSDSAGGTVIRYTSAGNVFGNISANLSSTGGITLSTTNSITTVNGSYLLSLIQSLSSDMLKIGNYPYARLTETQNSGVAGTSYATSSPYQTLRLNTKNVDDANIVGSFSNGQFSLNAGTYHVVINYGCKNTSFSLDATGYFKLRLRNVDDSITLYKWVDTKYPVDQRYGGCPRALEGRFTLSAQKTVRFDIRTFDFGYAPPASSDGENEVYWTVDLYKVG